MHQEGGGRKGSKPAGAATAKQSRQKEATPCAESTEGRRHVASTRSGDLNRRSGGSEVGPGRRSSRDQDHAVDVNSFPIGDSGQEGGGRVKHTVGSTLWLRQHPITERAQVLCLSRLGRSCTARRGAGPAGPGAGTVAGGALTSAVADRPAPAPGSPGRAQTGPLASPPATETCRARRAAWRGNEWGRISSGSGSRSRDGCGGES